MSQANVDFLRDGYARFNAGERTAESGSGTPMPSTTRRAKIRMPPSTEGSTRCASSSPAGLRPTPICKSRSWRRRTSGTGCSYGCASSGMGPRAASRSRWTRPRLHGPRRQGDPCRRVHGPPGSSRGRWAGGVEAPGLNLRARFVRAGRALGPIPPAAYLGWQHDTTVPFPAHLDPRAVRSGAGQLPCGPDLLGRALCPARRGRRTARSNGWFAPTDGRAA